MRTFGLILMLLLSSCVTTGGGSGSPVPPPQIAVARLSGPITGSSVGPLVAALEALPLMTVKPAAVVIEINSEGGEVDAGFALSKAIEHSPVPVICIVDGQAASMAFYILQSCTIRGMTARSSLMMHQVTMIGAIRTSNIKSLSKQLEVYNAAMVAQCAPRMKLPSDQIASKIAEGDWWMGASEALDVGAIDQIVPVSDLP